MCCRGGGWAERAEVVCVSHLVLGSRVGWGGGGHVDGSMLLGILWVCAYVSAMGRSSVSEECSCGASVSNESVWGM